MKELSDKDESGFKRIEKISMWMNIFIAVLGGTMVLGGIIFNHEVIISIGLVCWVLALLIIIWFSIRTGEIRTRIGKPANSDFYVVGLSSLCVGIFIGELIHLLPLVVLALLSIVIFVAWLIFSKVTS